MKFKLLRLYVISISLLFSANTYAGTLTINGNASISVTVSDNKIQISGSYEIKNSGDEKAINVFPSLKLGSWNWAGEPREVDQNTTAKWEIDGSLFTYDLISGQEISKDHALKGQFPLLVLRHYKDLNGVPFSAADVLPVALGSLSPTELSAIRVPTLAASYRCDGDGSSFNCLTDIRNLSDKPKKVSVRFHSSQELQVATPASIVEIPARGQTLVDSNIKNFSGLPGSNYATFTVIQWEEDGVNFATSVATQVALKAPRTYSTIVYLLCAVALLALILVLSKLRSKKS